MDDPFRRPSLGSALHYKDPLAALDWLEKAFGFERTMLVTDAEESSAIRKCASATATSWWGLNGPITPPALPHRRPQYSVDPCPS